MPNAISLRPSATQSLIWLCGTLLLLCCFTAAPAFVSGQSPTASGASLHAGFQVGPAALFSERTQALGAHHLGNTGYGQTVTVQSRWNGPWEVEFQGSQSLVTADDGALNGLQTEIKSAAVLLNFTMGGNETQRASTRNARMTNGFQPFIGIGLAHVDHMMKQDLEDASGRRYHLWSDGSLRDVDEAGDHAGNANILTRDYAYESDLNDMQRTHGSGQSLAIPAQLGIRLDVSPRVRARIGVSGWLGLTDRIDGQSSGRIASGDALATGFFGLGIRLGKLSKKLPPVPVTPGFTATDAALLASMDTDGDGVNNLRDRCPGTPDNAQVDEDGCPMDSDGDGYADYRDKEPLSRHTFVNSDGIAINRGMVTTQDWDTIRGQIISDLADLASFTLRVPKPEAGWTEAEQKSLMAFSQLKETSEAMEVRVGPNPDAADRAVNQLEANGLSAEIIDPVAIETPSAAIGTMPEIVVPAVHYRVQLGAFHAPKSAELDALFAGLKVVQFQGDDGITRIVSSAFSNRSDAELHKLKMEERGFIGAFLTTHGQDESTSRDAQHRESSENELQFDVSKLTFRIQLGALKAQVSTDALDSFLTIGQVEHRSAPGWHRYLQGEYPSMAAAKQALPTIQAAGFADAFVVGDVAGRVVPVAEAIILLAQD